MICEIQYVHHFFACTYKKMIKSSTCSLYTKKASAWSLTSQSLTTPLNLTTFSKTKNVKSGLIQNCTTVKPIALIFRQLLDIGKGRNLTENQVEAHIINQLTRNHSVVLAITFIIFAAILTSKYLKAMLTHEILQIHSTISISCSCCIKHCP